MIVQLPRNTLNCANWSKRGLPLLLVLLAVSLPTQILAKSNQQTCLTLTQVQTQSGHPKYRKVDGKKCWYIPGAKAKPQPKIDNRFDQAFSHFDERPKSLTELIPLSQWRSTK
jgi:hypothetical protein